LLTSEMEKTDKIVQYMEECRSMGLRVEPPDVNLSGARFTVATQVIHFGLAAIKNVGASAIESMVKAREQDGAFTSLADFWGRVARRLASRRAVERLTKAGAFASLRAPRAGLLPGLDQAMEAGQRSQRDRDEGKASLFDGLAGAKAAAPAAPARDTSAQVPEWPREELLAAEKEVLGFYLTGHPLDEYRDLAQRMRTVTAAGLAARPAPAPGRPLGLAAGPTQHPPT